MDLSVILPAMALMFLIMDPFGNVPLFLSVLRHVDPARHRRVIFRESVIALVFIIIFFFSGQHLLRLINVSRASVGIAGGIILFLIALKMIFSGTEEMFGHSEGNEDPLVVPLAIPLIAGPSCLTTVMLLMAKNPHQWPSWLAAILMAWVGSCAVLLSGSFLSRVLGKRGLEALERLMGMLLTAISVEMFIGGIRDVMESMRN